MLGISDWGDFFGASNDAVQTLAILIGGGWAYRKYIHNRANYASLLLEVDASVEDIGQRRCMSLTTKITNSGTYHMDFGIDCQQKIAVRCLDRTTWTDKCVDPQIRWALARRVGFDQLVDADDIRDLTTSLEPTESKAQSWLVPLPDGDWVAYRIVFRVEATKRAWRRQSEPLKWTTTKIVVTD